jgi:pimeloyl-ACP methyl ester carboxylesterase
MLAVQWSTLDTGDVVLAVASVGPESSPPVVVAPGVGSCAEFVVACWAPAVVGAGHRLVTYDLRGHARSSALADPSRHALTAHAADLAVVAVATGARLVGGFSLGGLAALTAVAGAGPTAAGPGGAGELAVDGVLVGMPARLGPGSVTAAANAEMARRVGATGVRGVLALIEADDAVPRWVVGELLASWPRHDPRSLVAALSRLSVEPPLATAALRSIPVPVGIGTFTDDPGHPLADAHAYADLIPHTAVRTTTTAAAGEDRGVVGATVWEAYLDARGGGAR